VRDRLYAYLCGAGGGARARYDATSSHWQKHVFRYPRLIAFVLAMPLVVVAIVEGQHRWLWMWGALQGGLLVGYIALLETPPARVEQWRTGFEGERRTAHELAPLRRSGFVLLHDLMDRQHGRGQRTGDLDHLVIGPSGGCSCSTPSG
jgi:Nuclease-related domain